MMLAVHHPVLAALAVLVVILVMLAVCLCVVAGKPVPRVDWNKEDYKQ